jgi:hypothetical protein
MYLPQIFQPPAMLAHRRTCRAAAAALFTVSCAAFPPGRRARAKIRPCAPLLTIHPAVSHSVILFSSSKIPQLTALAARTLPAWHWRHPSTPLQLLLAPLLRGVLPSSSPGGCNGGPRLHSHNNQQRAQCQLVAPPPDALQICCSTSKGDFLIRCFWAMTTSWPWELGLASSNVASSCK